MNFDRRFLYVHKIIVQESWAELILDAHLPTNSSIMFFSNAYYYFLSTFLEVNFSIFVLLTKNKNVSVGNKVYAVLLNVVYWLLDVIKTCQIFSVFSSYVSS